MKAVLPALTGQGYDHLAIRDIIERSGAWYVDGGIIGWPPRPGESPTRLYLSGPEAQRLAGLQTPELEIRVLGPSIGQASGLIPATGTPRPSSTYGRTAIRRRLAHRSTSRSFASHGGRGGMITRRPTLRAAQSRLLVRR